MDAHTAQRVWFFACFAVLGATVLCPPAMAQTATPTPTPAVSNVLQAEGIAGDVDKYSRSPLLSVGTQVSESGVKILADVATQNAQFVKYPIQVSFFINRKLFASQIRSPELPGPLGVDIGKDVATPPFNYTVVATLLHPNRTFTTVIQGAVFGTELAKNYDCTLSVTATDGVTSTDYAAEKIAATQTGNNAISLSFTGIDNSGSNQLGVKAAVTVSSDTATAVVTTTDSSGQTKEATLTGTASQSNGAIDSFDVSNSDQTETLNCSLTP